MFQASLGVTTKQKWIVDMHKIKGSKSKYTTMKNHQIKKEDSKRRRKERHNSQKTMNKMVIASPYLSIIKCKID